MKKNLGSKGFRFKWNEGVFFLQNLLKLLSALHEVYMSRILLNIIGSFCKCLSNEYLSSNQFCLTNLQAE